MRRFLTALALLLVPTLATAQDFTAITPTTSNVFTTYTGDIVAINVQFDLGSGYYSTEIYTGVISSGTLYVYAATGDQIYSGTPLNASYVLYTRTLVSCVPNFINAGQNTVTWSGSTMTLGTRAMGSPRVGPYGFLLQNDPPPPPPPPTGPSGPAFYNDPPPPPPPPTGPSGPAYVASYMTVLNDPCGG